MNKRRRYKAKRRRQRNRDWQNYERETSMGPRHPYWRQRGLSPYYGKELTDAWMQSWM